MSEFLSFEVSDELYAIPLMKVREILGGAPRLTRIPNSPSFLKGFISLRGAIIPVVDIREEFGLPAATYSKLTVVIVAEVLGATVGLVVDTAVDVVRLKDAEVKSAPPNLNMQVRAEFVSGLAEIDGRIIILLDLDRVLSDEQIGILKSPSTV
jgi:purine-binding chemotaxis protein CheW